MSKFKHFWIILVALAPLTASGVNAQQFGAPIDILVPVQYDLIRRIRQNPDQTDSRSSSTDEHSQSIHPEASQNCDDAIENVKNAVEAVDTSAPSSSVSLQLQNVQQANQLMAEQCKDQ